MYGMHEMRIWDMGISGRTLFGTVLERRETGQDKEKVKCTLVQALRLCTGRTAHRWSRGIAVLYRHWGSVQAVRSIGGVEV